MKLIAYWIQCVDKDSYHPSQKHLSAALPNTED